MTATPVGAELSARNDPTVTALVAAAVTLAPELQQQLLRRLTDVVHIQRERQKHKLSRAVLRDLRLVTALRAVADELGHPPLTTEYIAIYKRARAQGDSALPAVSVFVKRYGSWRAALFGAGLTGTPPPGLIHQRRLLRGRPAVYPRERMLACLRACARELSRVPTVMDYVAWREEHREAVIASGRVHPDFPHYNAIRRRFGGWHQALHAAGLEARLDRRNPPDWWTPLKTESPPWE